MIYLLLLVLAIFFNALMDVDTLGVFGNITKKRYYSNPSLFNWILMKWTYGETWKNKYLISSWLINKGIPESIANWLAKDVLVIFSDFWHFVKALMMLCFETPIAVLISPMFPFIPIWVLVLILFIIGGILFNTLYYTFRKL